MFPALVFRGVAPFVFSWVPFGLFSDGPMGGVEPGQIFVTALVVVFAAAVVLQGVLLIGSLAALVVGLRRGKPGAMPRIVRPAPAT